MKKGVNAWCFPESYSLKECMEIAQGAGFDGIEINMEEAGRKDTGVRLTLDAAEEDIYRIKDMAVSYGLEIPSVSTSLCWKYLLCSQDTGIREKGKDVIKKLIDAASILGSDTVLVVPGKVDEIHSYRNTYKTAQDSLKELAPYAEKNKVYIGVENVWNKFLLSPIELCRFIDEIGNPYVGAYFDVGNVVSFSYPEYWVEVLGDRIKKVHIKDFRRESGNFTGFVNLLEGDVNWDKVIHSLKSVGYCDYITAELSPFSFYPEVLIHQTSMAMDAFLGKQPGRLKA